MSVEVEEQHDRGRDRDLGRVEIGEVEEALGTCCRGELALQSAVVRELEDGVRGGRQETGRVEEYEGDGALEDELGCKESAGAVDEIEVVKDRKGVVALR